MIVILSLKNEQHLQNVKRVFQLLQKINRNISFTKFIKGSDFNLRSIDSFRFLASPLDKISSYMDDVPILSVEFKKDEYTTDQINLLKRKGAYPYDFTPSFVSLKVENLPPLQDF